VGTCAMDMVGGQHLREMWDFLAEVYGDKTALITESCDGLVQQFSYTSLNAEINRTANLFHAQGIRKGDHVALHLDNCPEFIFCWFGLAKIGAVMVPVNARLLQEESAWVIQNSQPRMLVTSTRFYPMYRQIQQECSTSLTTICLIDATASHSEADVCDFHALKAQQPATLNYAPPLSTQDTAEILFTSGTTSRPKGVVITHYNLRFAGYYSSWQCALRDDDIYLTVMPAFHIDCQCTAAMAAFSAGATFVLIEKYSARAFWRQVRHYRATVTECIPMMIRTLMVQPPAATDRQHQLREVMFYLNLSVQEKDAFIERFGVRLLTSYGMTETIVGIIGDRPGDKRRWPSIGRPGFCYEADIRDDHNQSLPPGEIGEICIKGEPGKTIFKEYYARPDATAQALEADGWLHTGDSGYRDTDGFFYFLDRRCNMIKRGGENVSCVELENIIAAHPKIQDIVVIGIKDAIRDEAIKAFVVLNEGETLSEEEFFSFCSAHMAKFKVPSYMEIRTGLPRNCSGKIIKKNLR
jgi:Acyl-CoA synthetases (AMP-forming)/AMP-acid ligases II